MAKLRGSFIELGRKSNVCAYQLNGEWYLRSKSTLSRKRVLKSKAFAKTRQYASCMAIASRLASAIYQTFPKEKRDRAIYQAMTGMAATNLYNGVKEEEVRVILLKNYKRLAGMA